MKDSRGRSAGAANVDGRRRRVLFLVGQLGWGGSEGQLRLLARHLDASAWEPMVLVFHSSPNGDHVNELREAGIDVASMPRQIFGPLGKLRFVTGVASRFRPQVVHSWTVHDNPFAAWAGRVSGAQVRWGSLRGSTTLPSFSSLPAWYRRLALRSVQRLVVNSKSLADELYGLGIHVRRVLVIPNCVQAAAERPSPKGCGPLEEFGFRSGDRVFGSIGNIRRAKNQLLFVRALARVAAQNPEVRGLIVGETLMGEEATRFELESEIERRGLGGRVVLAGFRADVRSLMGGFAALCLTSDSEGMPNVVLEAMADGVPVVATAVGGVPEVVQDGVTGYLVTRGDEDAYADAIARLLKSPEEARRMAASAREFVLGERSCVRAASRLEAAYREALGGEGVS